jgi:hypothetical protein
MVCFQTKKSLFGKFWTALQWKMLEYFVAFCFIFGQFGIFHGHLVYFSRFGMLYPEKSGNPAQH